MERGYVLHHRPYQESNVIVNLLVDGIGRVDAVARVGHGRHSIKSILQPFQPLIFTLSGRSELKTLAKVEAMAPAIPLAGDSLYAGMYLNELLIRILHHGGESLFFEYHSSLIALANEFAQAPLRYFEQALLVELGSMPSLVHDALNNKIQDEIEYQYLDQQGFLPVCPEDDKNFEHSAQRLGHYSGQSLIRLRDKSLQQADLKQIKMLMRQLLGTLLGDKPLISRSLFIRRLYQSV